MTLSKGPFVGQPCDKKNSEPYHEKNYHLLCCEFPLLECYRLSQNSSVVIHFLLNKLLLSAIDVLFEYVHKYEAVFGYFVNI